MKKKISDLKEWKKNNEIKLITRAWEDEVFKNELIKNPKATIEKEFNIEIISGINIHVLEETEKEIYLVLPVNPNPVFSDELTEEELEVISGGGNPDTSLC